MVYKPVLRTYTGGDAAQKFMEMLEEDIKKLLTFRKWI